MPALSFFARTRGAFFSPLIFVAGAGVAVAQTNPLINGIANPTFTAGSQTLNLLDFFSGTLSVGGTATLNLAADYTTGLPLAFSGSGSSLSYTAGTIRTLSLSSGGSLTRSGSGGYTYVYANLANSGTVTISGGTLQFQSGTTFTNAASGTTSVTGAGSMLYVKGLVNSGTLDVSNSGVVQLAGSYTSANLGSVTTSSGGAVQLIASGALNNASTTFSLPAGSALTLAGGSITGGSIASGSLALSSTGGTLDGATVNGSLSVGNGQVVTLKNAGAGATGLTTVNTGTLYLGSDLTANANSSFIFTGNGSYLTYGSGSVPTLTLPSTVSLTRSGAGGYTYVYDHLSNSGTVTISGGTLQFQSGTTLTNASGATTTVTGSGSVLYLQGLANSGTLSVDTNGVVQLAGAFTTAGLGAFTTASGGLVQLSGTLNNASANLSFPSGSALTLAGGTITGGTIASGSLALSTSGGTLNGTTVNGNLSVGNNQVVTLKNAGAGATGATTVNAGTIYLGTDLSAAANSSFLFTGNGSYLTYGSGAIPTFTLPSTASLTRSGAGGYTYVYDHLSNSGSVTISGGTLQFQSGTTFTNASGATTTVTGAGSTLYLQGLANAGTLGVDTNGVVQLTGAFTTAGLGSFTTASGGLVQLTGTLNNTAANLSLPSGSALTLAGGIVTGGTIASGSLALSSAGGTLNSTTVNGNLAVGNGQVVTLKNPGAGATGLTTVNTGTIYLGSDVTANANSSFVFTGNGSYLSYGTGTIPTLTLPSTVSLTRSGAGGYTYVYDNLFNSGAVTISGGTLQFQSGTTFTNASGATTTVTGAGSLLYLLGLTNAGTIAVDTNGIVQLAGSFTTANLGTFTFASGGAAQLSGTLNNTGATLSLPSGGTYGLNGGTIVGGNITGATLALTSSGGTLDGATINGDLTVGSGQTLTLKNTAGFTGNATVGTTGQSGGTLYLGSDLSLTPGNNLTLTGTSSSLDYTSGIVRTFMLPASTNLTRTGAGYSYAYDHFANSGNFVVNGGTLYLNGNVTNSNSVVISNGANAIQSTSNTFLNTGTANVTGASSLLAINNVTNSAGTLIADAGGLLQLTGSFLTANLGSINIATGGAVQIAGTLDNTAANSILNPPTGGAYLLTGTIHGGNIVDTALIEKSGTLDGATVQGNITLGATPTSNPTLTLKNNAGFTGNATVGTAGQTGGTLYLGSDLTLAASNNLTLTGTSSSLDYSGGTVRTLTIPASATLTRTGAGYSYNYDNVINAGSVIVSSGTLYNNGSQFTQTAGTLKVDGNFVTPTSGANIQGGSVSGLGTISGNTTFTSGTLDPGAPLGTLTFAGNLTLTGGAITNLELGAGVNDRVTVSGGGNSLVFGGTLNILAVSTAFASGQTWNVFSFTGHSGSFSTINLPFTSSGWVWDTSQLTTTGALTLTTFVPVPEPSTYALLAAGLGLVFLLRRRAIRH